MEDGGWKRIALDGKKERFVQKRAFCLRKRAVFSAHVKPTDKEKTFFSAQRHRLRTTPKLTCSNPFRISLAAVSLQYTFPFSKNISLASALR